MNHQFSIFNERTMRRKTKVPISEARIKEVQALIAKGDGRGAAEKLRSLREGLEDYEKRITNTKK